MQHAAMGVQDISGNIITITKNASEADHAAREVLRAAQSMSQQSEMLKQQVSHFLSGIKG